MEIREYYFIYVVYLNHPGFYTGPWYVGITTNIGKRKRKHFTKSTSIFSEETIEALMKGRANAHMFILDATPSLVVAKCIEQVLIQSCSKGGKHWVVNRAIWGYPHLAKLFKGKKWETVDNELTYLYHNLHEPLEELIQIEQALYKQNKSY